MRHQAAAAKKTDKGLDIKIFELEAEREAVLFKLGQTTSTNGTPHGGAGLSWNDLPPGLAMVGDDAHIEPSLVDWTMSGGYRLFDHQSPPWDDQKLTVEPLSMASLLSWTQQAEASVEAMRERIHKDYGANQSHEKHFYNRKLFPSGDSENGLRLVSSDALDKVAARLLHVLLGGAKGTRRFTFAFTGHSNLAGHGNYFDHTYPFAMARTLAEAFQPSGISLVTLEFGPLPP